MDVARGEINIGLNDKATPELRRIEAEYRASMARIDAMEAEATISANLEQLDVKLKEAKDKVRQLKGVKASIGVDADTGRLDAQIAKAEAMVKKLDGQKATIELKTRGEREALANIAKVSAAEAARAAANERYARQSERAAAKQNELHTRAELVAAKEQERIVRLHREYAKLTDQIEVLDRRRTPFGREAKQKLEVDRAGAIASLERVKAELNVLGGHPPVHIRVDTDRTGMSRAQRAFLSLRESAASIADKIGNAFASIPGLRVMGNRLSTIIKVAGALAPVLVSLGGAAVGLVGVLGTGLAGAAAVAAAGLTGLLMNLGGLKAALSPVAKDFKINTQAVDAYHKAVLKYGKGSEEALKAQTQMNNVLKNMDPAARKAAEAAGALRTQWTKLTQKDTAQAFNSTVLQGSKTLSALMPTLARNTNESSRLISNSLNSLFQRLRTPAGIHIFDSLGKSTNQFLGPALDGINSLVMAFLHVSEAAGRLFAGKAGDGFRKWASDIEAATQPGAKLDAQVQRLGDHATDLIHFFGALGRLMTTVFNGGADSGDRMLRSMTDALNRWNEFLKTPEGQRSMADFFQRAEDGARALWSALGPLIGAFIQWSSLLAPFTSGLLKGIGFVANLVAGFTKLVGLGGPLAALGATLGAAFAVSKLATFVGMLARVASGIRAVGAAAIAARAGGVAGMFNAGRDALAQQRAGTGVMAAGGAEAGAEIRAAMVSGGAAAAAEIRGAMVGGGAAAGGMAAGEGALAGAGAGAARSTERVATAAERSAGRLRTAGMAAANFAGGLVGIPGPAMAVVAAGAAMIAGFKLLDNAFNSGARNANRHAAELERTVLRGADGVARSNTRYMEARDTLGQFGSSLQHSNISLREARKALDGAKKGTQEYRDRLLELHDAEREHTEARKTYFEDQNRMNTAAKNQVQNANAAVDANKREIATLEERAKAGGLAGKMAQLALDNARGRSERLLSVQQAAWNRLAALPMQAARGIRGFAALTGQAEQAVGRLARTAGGKEIAQRVSIKYDDPAKAGRVAAQARAALNAGVGKGTVLKIIGDSSDAEEALRRLQSMTLKKKIMHVGADIADALAGIRGVNAKPIGRKILQILQNGAQGVLGILARISGYNVGTAIKRIVADDRASGVLAALRGAHDLGTDIKHILVVTRHAKAMGGPVSVGTNVDADVARAMRLTAGQEPRRTQGGMYNRPSLLVGEEDRPEYVIATNPAYRQANREYLKMAASDLGMVVVEAAKKGRRAASPSTPGVAGTRADAAALGVPDPYTVGAVPLDQVESVVSAFDTSVKRQHDLVKSLTTTLKGVKVPKPTHRHGKVTNQKTIDNARDRRHDLAQHIRAATRGGNWRNLHYRSLKDLDREDAAAKTDLKHLKHYNSQIALLNQRIARDRTQMSTDAAAYARTGKVEFLNDYNAKKKDRSDAIDALIGADGQGGLLGVAKSGAQSLASKFPTDAMKEWISDLETQIAEAGGEREDDAGAEAPTGPETPSFETWLSTHGLTDRVAIAARDYAMSQVNDVPDDPTTTANENIESLSDNLSTAATVRDIYRQAYDTAVREGAPASIITEAAGAFTTARDTFQSISDTITGAGPSSANQQQMALSTARQELYTQMGSNFSPIWTQSGAVPVGFGPTPAPGGAGVNPASTESSPVSVTVHNTFPTPPPDPHTWSQGLSWELQAAL